jgi:hypothetical protein
MTIELSAIFRSLARDKSRKIRVARPLHHHADMDHREFDRLIERARNPRLIAGIDPYAGAVRAAAWSRRALRSSALPAADPDPVLSKMHHVSTDSDWIALASLEMSASE